MTKRNIMRFKRQTQNKKKIKIQRKKNRSKKQETNDIAEFDLPKNPEKLKNKEPKFPVA